MALPSNTFTTYLSIGNREDLSDEVYRIDPTETPFITGIEREKATATNHEWQLQSLATAASNAQLEGDDATADAVTPTVRRGNICQISRKVPRLTGTEQSINHAGPGNTIEDQEMLKGLELRRDMESILLGNTAKNVGAAATARLTASVLSWIKTNTSFGATGVDPAAADGTGTRTDGTQRAFTEILLKAVLAKAWLAGGKPNTIMVGAFNKQAFSLFTGRSTPTEQAKSKKIVASVVEYDSDFGMLDIVPNRFMRGQPTLPGREALILQMEMWAVAYLNGRKFLSTPLAKTGDSDWKLLLSEYALVSRNEAASGIVADLTTS